jgi:predicted metal-dependent enzyme (double-stranded beta helix superfamily)
MQVPSYSLDQFSVDAERIVRGNSTESEMMLRIKPLLERLLTSNDVPAEAFTPRQDRFAMNLLHMPKDRVVSVIGGVWQPGQTTPIHDHLTWALIGVYEGEEREAIYRRLDDRSDPKHAKLEKVSERINGKGHVTVLGRAGIHKVDNVSDEVAKSIHVYGVDIGNTERHSYDPVTGDIGVFLSGYCNVLRDPDPF